MYSLLILTLLAALTFGRPILRRNTSYSSGDTASDVENGVCAPITVIFARGTGEAGNIGALLGPQLFQKIISDLNGNVALQGVNYPADWFGNFQQGATGSSSLSSLVDQALANCPSTKIVLAGYSQGAMVVHYALNQGGLASSKIAGAVYFGDPREWSRWRKHS